MAKQKQLGFFFRTLVDSLKKWKRLHELVIYKTKSDVSSSRFVVATESRNGIDTATVVMCFGKQWESLSVNKTTGGAEIAFLGSLERDEFFEFIAEVHKLMSAAKSSKPKRPPLTLVRSKNAVPDPKDN